MSSSQKGTWVCFSLIIICTFDIRGKPSSYNNTLMWWNWHAAQASAELMGRERCLFPEGQAFCVEKLLARWDRGVNCRSITPNPHSLFSLPSHPPSNAILAPSFLFICNVHILALCSNLHLHLWPSNAHILNHLPHTLPLSLSALHTLTVSFSVWNQQSNRWHHLWFMAHSERTLIRCRQGSACAWMTMEDQSHYASQPRPLHSGHCRLHLAPWFMDAILAPERDMRDSLEVRGWRLWFLGPASALGQRNFVRNLVELCFICMCVCV